MGKIINLPSERMLKIKTNKNQVIVGDCLDWLRYVPDESVDCCYIDPPFFSNRNYEVVWGNGYELRAFGDRWKGGIAHYIEWMRERVLEIYRVLKPTGSIFLHCDWHASHRLRVMLDEVFGENNFVNEIIWCYSGGGASKRWFSKKHDTIFFYTKRKEYVFNPQKVPRTEKSIKRLQNPNGARVQKDSSKDWDKKNCLDWWEDIQILNPMSKERIGYNTQKPEALLERIIKCSTNENDLVLDCFGGGGTTAAVAAKLGRKFITGDVSPVAVKVICERLGKLGKPLKYDVLNVPRTKKEWLAMDGKDFEKKICDFMGWDWTGRGTDGGIDGWANKKTIPIQIKNQGLKAGRPDIQKLVGAMGKRKKAIFVAWDFSSTAWAYKAKIEVDSGKELLFIKVGEEILRDILISDEKGKEIADLYNEKTA